VRSSDRFLNSSAAAARLGVSAKALRLYEQRGLVTPGRTAAGWRAYGPDDMARAAEVVVLRGLGLSLAQVSRVLAGHPDALEAALAAHQTKLEAEVGQLHGAIDGVRRLRARLAAGERPAVGEIVEALGQSALPGVGFALPWPWGGEWFELNALRAITYIVGPLGSGKTRLAKRLAEEVPGAVFLGPERQAGAAPDTAEVDRALEWLIEEGATESDALLALLAGIMAEGATAVVVDMVEDGLDQPTQEAVIGYLRRRGAGARPLVLMTRSSAILDLGAVGAGEAILYCPANHSPPLLVLPYPGAPGFEALAMCLATPEVRARTAGVVAFRPPAG
jgi:DNA-binding transcriptional MerR regulator